MNSRDKKIAVFFVIFLSAYILAIGVIDWTIPKPVSVEGVEKFTREWTVTRDVKTDKESIFNSLTNMEKFQTILPQYINSVQIINKTQDEIICKGCQSLISDIQYGGKSKRTVEFVHITTAPIKTEFIAKHIIFHDEYFHTLQILTGDAKGSIIEQAFSTPDDTVQIKTAFRLQLEGLLKTFGNFQKPTYIKFTIPIIDQMIHYVTGFDKESEKIVDDLYRELLKRPADSQGLSHYAPMIEKGTLTAEELRGILLESEERKLILETDERKSINELGNETRKIVNDLYNEILYRDADRIGMEMFGSLLEADKITENELRNILLESEEKKMIVEPHEKKTVDELNAETKQRIDSSYQEMFLHKADKKGLEYWGSLIEAEKITYDELREILKRSPEYIVRNDD